MDQQRFEFGEGAGPGKRKRHPGRRRVARRMVAETLALTPAPQQQRCGRCGHQQTVLGETAVCTECGGLIMRSEGDEDPPEWPAWAKPAQEEEEAEEASGEE